MNTTLKCCIHGLGATFFDDEISLVLFIQEVKDYIVRSGAKNTITQESSCCF